MPKAPPKASHCYSLRPRKPNTQGIAKPSKKADKKPAPVEHKPTPETVDRNATIPSTEECWGSVTLSCHTPSHAHLINFNDEKARSVEDATEHMSLRFNPETGQVCVLVAKGDNLDDEFIFVVEAPESNQLLDHMMQQLKALHASMPSVCLCNIPVQGYPGYCEQYHFRLIMTNTNTMVVKVVRSGTDGSEYISFTAHCDVNIFLSKLESFKKTHKFTTDNFVKLAEDNKHNKGSYLCEYGYIMNRRWDEHKEPVYRLYNALYEQYYDPVPETDLTACDQYETADVRKRWADKLRLQYAMD